MNLWILDHAYAVTFAIVLVMQVIPTFLTLWWIQRIAVPTFLEGNAGGGGEAIELLRSTQ